MEGEGTILNVSASPRLFTSGPVLTCPGGYPENVWGPSVAFTIKGRYQAQDRVQKLSGLGMDVIKNWFRT